MDPKALKELKHILEQEEGVLSRLLNLEKDKNRILVSGDYGDLPVVTEKEDTLTEALSGLEEKRIAILPAGPDSRPLSGIISSSQPEGSSDWKVRQSHLTGLLKELRLYNDMNRRILEESIAFFRYSLSLFTGDDPSSPTYTPSGERNQGPGRASLVLDRSI